MDCSSWWFDHVGETYAYVLATKNGDAGMQAASVEKLMNMASEWGNLLGLPVASKMMAQHTLGAKSLVDGAFAADQAAIDASVDTLLGNVDTQTGLYDNAIANFPTEEWKNLFTAHVAATGQYVLALAAGDTADFKKHYATVIQNRNALGRFWGQVCMGLKRR
jgi:hypothetical protein